MGGKFNLGASWAQVGPKLGQVGGKLGGVTILGCSSPFYFKCFGDPWLATPAAICRLA